MSIRRGSTVLIIFGTRYSGYPRVRNFSDNRYPWYLVNERVFTSRSLGYPDYSVPEVSISGTAWGISRSGHLRYPEILDNWNRQNPWHLEYSTLVFSTQGTEAGVWRGRVPDVARSTPCSSAAGTLLDSERRYGGTRSTGTRPYSSYSLPLAADALITLSAQCLYSVLEVPHRVARGAL